MLLTVNTWPGECVFPLCTASTQHCTSHQGLVASVCTSPAPPGCLEVPPGNANTVHSVYIVLYLKGVGAISWRLSLTSSFFWLVTKMDSLSFFSCSCSSRRELIRSVAAVSYRKKKHTHQSSETNLRHIWKVQIILDGCDHKISLHNYTASHTNYFWPPLQVCCWSSRENPS